MLALVAVLSHVLLITATVLTLSASIAEGAVATQRPWLVVAIFLGVLRTQVLTVVLLTGAPASSLPQGQGVRDDAEGELIFLQALLLILLFFLVSLAQRGQNLSPVFLLFLLLVLWALNKAVTFLFILLVLLLQAAQGDVFSLFLALILFLLGRPVLFLLFRLSLP